MADGPIGKAGRPGEATLERINDLRSGWELPQGEAPDEPRATPGERSSLPKGAAPTAPTPGGRKKGPTGPPAPPVQAKGNASGTVRLPDRLPRQAGILGDVAYLFRVWAKQRSCKREMAKLAEQIARAQEDRNQELLQVARQAIGDERNDQTLVGRARASLLEIEEKHSLHAGRVAAADEEMVALARHRSDNQNLRVEEAESLDKEVDAINSSLEPLQVRSADARTRAGELRRQLHGLDEKICQQETRLVAITNPAERTAVHATMAGLRAERDTIAADEPMLAAEIDGLEPKIASLIATRSALADKSEDLAQERDLDEIRVTEKEHAVQASRTVENRAVDDQANKRQGALLELGEALHNKPADEAAPRVRAIDEHDLEIGILERRRLDLKELLSSVQYLPMIRGGIGLLVVVACLAAALYFALSR